MAFLYLLLLSFTAFSIQDPYTQVEQLIKKEQYTHAESALATILSTLAAPNALDYFKMGNLFCTCGNLSQALIMFTKTSKLLPGNMSPVYNIAYILKLMGRLDEAIALYTTIITIDPNHDAAHLGLAFAYLQKGDYKNGWKAHEYNLKKQGKFAESLRMFIEKNELSGKKILMTPEGGLGDSIQFIRYAKRFHDAGAYVMVVPQKAIVPLFSLCDYIDQLIEPGTPVPPYDAHVTLMSCPAALHDDPENFSSTIPYLYANPHLVEKWQLAIGADRRFKIGICWQADIFNDSSRIPIARRGIPLSCFERLNNYENISWYSLQKCDGVEQLAQRSANFNITVYEDLDATHGAFMDTAALIESLDLVITIDSAIAHLAGALGKEVWLLLPYVTDWRWLESQSTSPWYPTMTIFKQDKPFDWSNVITQLNRMIAQKSANHAKNVTTVATEVSVGELIDKITILNIKNNKINDTKKLKNIRTELATLRATQKESVPPSSMLDVLETELFTVNNKLWEIEDKIRDKEREKNFDDEFIELARSVYFTNDHRMSIKSAINQLCGSRLHEEKSYKKYA